MNHISNQLSRREAMGLAAAGALALSGRSYAEPAAGDKIVLPPAGKKVLLSVKLGMIATEEKGKKLTIAERLKLAGDAGFDGVDFDEAGSFTPEQARAAVQESGVFVHNAINHAHWKVRLTSPDAATRAKALANLEHCIRVSHAAGGSGVLIVVGSAADGPAEETEARCREEMKKAIPLAASLGQRILVENVWNKMMYDHDSCPAKGGPEQGPERFISFVDSFNSPWIGMYYDLGNHWKYGQVGAWLKAFGARAPKLDVKGFSRKKDSFVDITSEDDDVPWADVRKVIAETGWTGWTTAEVGGGGLERLTIVRKQMEKAFGIGQA
jgi:L-ribulose-5-phosphate 3-epimerase